MRIQYQGDIYVSGREAAKWFKVSHTWFSQVYTKHLKTYPIPGYGREYYKLSDFEQYNGPRPAEDQKE